MTVNELITVLQKYPADYVVSIEDSAGDFEEITEVNITELHYYDHPRAVWDSNKPTTSTGGYVLDPSIGGVHHSGKMASVVVLKY